MKFTIYKFGEVENISLSGSFEKIGLSDGTFQVKNASGNSLNRINLQIKNHESAVEQLLEWLETNHHPAEKLDAVGHRFVHGGDKFRNPTVVTPEVLQDLKSFISLAPDHIPQAIKAVEAIAKNYPGLRQVLSFDTAFHADMPKVAKTFPLTRELIEQGLKRYGFHGLSYEYIMQEINRVAGSKGAEGRILIAHLGSGCSMAAVKDGKSIDTTMGFTPTGGLMMSTRSGDLDPGVMLYLLHEKKLSPETINDILNKQAGLYGISDISSDMGELLEIQNSNSKAREAIELFCYLARKFLGAMTAALGGLDTLVFTGGIGENAPLIRKLICTDMGFMNIKLDESLNLDNAPVISSDDSSVTVRVIKTNEELMIARHTYKVICNSK